VVIKTYDAAGGKKEVKKEKGGKKPEKNKPTKTIMSVSVPFSIMRKEPL
jgi:hypothetical protein